MGSTIATSNPQLAGDLRQMPEPALKLVSTTLPKLADAARETGRAVKDSVSGMASSAGGAIQQALPGGEAVRATGAALISAAALQATQRGIVRLVMRRPYLFALGGLAIVGGLVLASRRKAGSNRVADDASGDDGIGEGRYSGARDYHDRTKSFLKSEGKHVAERARQAKKALKGREGRELEAAEAEGRRRARS